jgi:hypothetical protein
MSDSPFMKMDDGTTPLYKSEGKGGFFKKMTGSMFGRIYIILVILALVLTIAYCRHTGAFDKWFQEGSTKSQGPKPIEEFSATLTKLGWARVRIPTDMRLHVDVPKGTLWECLPYDGDMATGYDGAMMRLKPESPVGHCTAKCSFYKK